LPTLCIIYLRLLKIQVKRTETDGLRFSVAPQTESEALNIGDVIRRGELAEEGTADHPTSRRYELKARDGATLKVIIDFDRKKDKNKSVINFYSDRTSDTGAHNVSSGIITDSVNNIQPFFENTSWMRPQYYNCPQLMINNQRVERWQAGYKRRGWYSIRCYATRAYV
jgi:hypothetical protein